MAGRHRLGGALLLPLLALATPAAAQVRPAPPARPDTTVRDTAARDTTHVPSTRAALADSIIRALQALPGYVPTEYKAEEATYDVDQGTLKLEGKAEVVREGDRLTADTIVYRQRQQFVEAIGTPKVAGQSQELTGRVLFYDLAAHRATVLGAQTTVSQGANWIVRGDVTAEDRTATMYATHGVFTTCDLEIPHYHFESDRIKVVKDKYLVARPARLYFGKVPVMVLPFVVQSLERGRRSGLIVPRFAVTDIVRNSRGQTREITDLGYYWAINDYLGAQVTTTWRSGAYTSLAGNLDYRWRRQFLDGNVAYRRYWQNNGDQNYTINTGTSWRPDERTTLGVSGNYATSTQFIRRTSIDPREATQSLGSSLSLSRRFDWGNLSLGGTGQQQISDGSISMTLPNFSISPNTVTLFRSLTPELAHWWNDVVLTWNLSGDRSLTSKKGDFLRGIQDRSQNRLQGGLQSFRIGNLSFSATGDLQQSRLFEEVGRDSLGAEIGVLPAQRTDVGSWAAGASYQVKLIGQTSISPTLSLGQIIRRDSLSNGLYVQSPTQLTFGAGTSTALFGFYPGFGPFSAIRHRITPSISYGYSPAVRQTPIQERVFGTMAGGARNLVTLSFSQTWEGKLKEPQRPARPDSLVTGELADTSQALQPSVPTEPQKVTLLSINTSSLQYDISRRRLGESGFLTTTLSNTITSDYLHGLTVQVQHELFDQSGINPNDPRQRGRLGAFSPRLAALNTGFELGPSSAIFRWLGFGQVQGDNQARQGAQPGTPPVEQAQPSGQSSFTGNEQSAGAGPWRVGIQYAFTRQPRTFRNLADMTPEQLRLLARQNLHETDQTVMADMGFSLTPHWAVTWNTQYSMADHQFAGHRLTFKRNLHRWQANFSFYQTPAGNSAFEVYVELIDNPDLKVNYRDYNLGIDRR